MIRHDRSREGQRQRGDVESSLLREGGALDLIHPRPLFARLDRNRSAIHRRLRDGRFILRAGFRRCRATCRGTLLKMSS